MENLINDQYFTTLKANNHFESLKNLYDNLTSITVENNMLIFPADSNLSNVNLKSLKLEQSDNMNYPLHSLYNRSLNDVHNITTKLVYIEENKNILDSKNKINFLLLNNSNISQEETNNIIDYVDYFFEIWSLASLYQCEYLKNIYDFMNETVLKCYLPEYASLPNYKMIKNYLDDKFSDSLSQGAANEKATVRIKNTTGGTGSTDSFDKYNIAGFASAALALSISITIGITLAVIALFLGT